MKNAMKKTICLLLSALLLSASFPATAEGTEPTQQEPGLTQPVGDTQEQNVDVLEEDIPPVASAALQNVGTLTVALSAGTLNKEFDYADTTEEYPITLGADEEEFSITVTEADATSTLSLQVGDGDWEQLTSGVASDPIALEVGQSKEIFLKARAFEAQGNGEYDEKTYTFTAHRTNTQLTWALGERTPLDGGDLLVPITVSATAGAQLASVIVKMNFDNTLLSFCNSEGTVSEDRYDLVYLGNFGSYFTDLPDEISNDTGELGLQFGRNMSTTSQGDYFTVPDTGELFTAYFRLSGALRWNSFTPGECSIGESINETLTNCAYAGMLTVDGLPAACEVTGLRDAFTGGSLTLSSSAPAVEGKYTVGDTLTITAAAEALYRFDDWTGVPANAAEDGATLTITLTGDLDLSELEPVFYDALPESKWVSRHAPYEGDTLLTVNTGSGSVAVSASRSSDAVNEPTPSEFGTDGDGSPIYELTGCLPAAQADPLLSASASYLSKNPNVEIIGTEATHSIYNLTRGQFEQASFTLVKVGERYKLWYAVEQPGSLTDAQLTELGTSFDASLLYLEPNGYGSNIYDKNENGKLDILLYDLAGDGLAGVALNEMYNIGGNFCDVVHVDSMYSLQTIKSTLAHETQHLIAYSLPAYRANLGSTDPMPPTWLNEGLSMAVEHALFGGLDGEDGSEDRIGYFNHSATMRAGVSLTEWSSTLDNYALSYLFVQYLRTQAEAAGSTNFLQNFYTDYTGDDEAVILNIIRQLPQFKDMTFGEVVACFYAALALKEKSGEYGFNGEETFDKLLPQQYNGSVNLPKYAAIYHELSESATPSAASGIMQLGLNVTACSSEALYNEVSDENTALELSQVVVTAPERLADRNLSWGDNDTIDIYLDVESETSVSLKLTTETTVAGITVNGLGNTATALEYTDADPVREWTTTLTWQADPEANTATLTTSDGEEGTRTYTINLHDRTGSPTATLKQGADANSGNIVLEIDPKGYSVYTAGVSFTLTAAGKAAITKTTLETAIAKQATYELTSCTVDAQGVVELLLNAPKGTTAGVGSVATVVLAEEQDIWVMVQAGSVDVTNNNTNRNYISAAEIGECYASTTLEGIAIITGAVKAYNNFDYADDGIKSGDLPTVTFKQTDRSDVLAEVTLNDPEGTSPYGLHTFNFTAQVQKNATYTLEAAKANHTKHTTANLTSEGETAIDAPLRLYVGDLNGDGSVDCFDSDVMLRLLSTGSNDSSYDLDGDGKLTLFDMDLLTGKANYGKQSATDQVS